MVPPARRRAGNALAVTTHAGALRSLDARPDFVSDDELAHVRRGNLQWEARPEGSWEAILDYVSERMQRTEATWVVPDSVARTSDPVFGRNNRSEYFVVDETPYYVAREPDPLAIERAWYDAQSAGGALAVLTLGQVPTASATDDDLRRLAEGATDVAVEAYDNSRRMIFFSANPAGRREWLGRRRR